MSKFDASILALLDTSKIQGQIKDIEKLQVNLNNIKINIPNLSSQIQKELSKQNFSISIKNSSLDNAAKTIKAPTFDKQSLSKLQTYYNRMYELQSKKGSYEARVARGKDSSVTVKELNKQIAEMQKEYDSLKGKYFNNFSKSQKDKLSYNEKNIGNKVALAKSEAKTISSLDKVTLSNKMSTWLSKNSRAAKDYGETINILKKQLEGLGEGDVAGFENIQNQFKNIQQSAIAAGKTGKSFVDSFKNIAKAVLPVVSAVDVLRKSIEVLKDMYKNVYEIDTAMTNLYKVTDASSSRYETFLDSSKKSAVELGRTVSSLIEQSATWAKLGYSLDDSEKLSKLSSIYANVGEVDDETAVSDMVTAMKAFGIEAENAVTIVDALNELGNRFATSASALGDGLSKSASSLHLAGTDMNQSLAMLTGMAEITQNANESGNALKIFSMRIRGMKGELEELGEEVDPTVDSISKVQTQILNLTKDSSKGAINIFDSSGEFRNYYDIMKDIADVFDELNSKDKADLSEILFGKQRGNQGAALIQAFTSGQIEKAYETAANSAGSAQKEQDRWMESLEAKTNQLKASWEGLSETIMNSDFLKALVDGATKFLNITDKAVKNLGLLPSIIGGIGLTAFIKNLD